MGRSITSGGDANMELSFEPMAEPEKPDENPNAKIVQNEHN